MENRGDQPTLKKDWKAGAQMHSLDGNVCGVSGKANSALVVSLASFCGSTS
jgi:hypothetical protein